MPRAFRKASERCGMAWLQLLLECIELVICFSLVTTNIPYLR